VNQSVSNASFGYNMKREELKFWNWSSWRHL